MRDWSTLRERDLQVPPPSGKESCAGGKARPGQDAQLTAPPRPGGASLARTWRTDVEISSAGKPVGGDKQQLGLKRWEGGDGLPSQFNGTLEELSGGSHKSIGQWNQFKANEELFGVVSTFKSDLSQYTTPLDPKRVPIELRRRADKIAQEIDRTNSHTNGRQDGIGSDGEDPAMDEEERYASVPRGDVASGAPVGSAPRGSGAGGAASAAAGGAAGDRQAGGDLLATLRAGAGPVSGEVDYRSLVGPKVQGWWRARSSSGAVVPPGAEDGLVCPFSQRAFGDVSHLVMHWAAALPRAEDRGGCESASAITERFRLLSQQLRWRELAATTGLGAKLSVEAPRPGSVWAQLLAKLERTGPSGGSPVEERLVDDFVNEALLMRCWRRDQRVEHREVLEGIAAGLALHALEAPPAELNQRS